MLDCSCFPFSKHKASHLNQNVLFWSHLSIKLVYSNFLACPCDLQQTVDRQQCCFGEQRLFACDPAMHAMVVQWFPIGGLMNINIIR